MPTRPLAGVVLAAGAGTRLRPLTRFRPKALCPVGNRPLVDHAVDRVRRHTTAVAVNVHAERAQMERHLADQNVHISVEEPHALGTAGALGQLLPWMDGRDVLVTNADAWSPDNLDALLSGWDRRCARLLVVADATHGDFPSHPSDAVKTLRYAGSCLLPWDVVRALEPVPSGLYEVCWRPLERAGRLALITSQEVFIDCGTPADYLQANMDWSGGVSVVGEGARVEGTIERCVVWPGAVVAAHERLVDAVRVGTDVTVT